jgi:type VI protein secretion system component VasK
MMDDLVLKFRILLRAEAAIRNSQIRLAVRQARLTAVGLVLALLALGMLNVAIYLALETRLGGSTAALLLAVVNGILALILILAAGRMQTGPEVDMAEEIRDLAVTEIAADADELKQELQQIRAEVTQISSGFRRLLGGDLSLLGLPNLSPLIGVLASSLKNRKK